MANSESTATLEKVVPDDGRRENLWLIISVIIILIAAAITLKFNRAEVKIETPHLELGVTGKAMLTALRNAADEITFMSEERALLPTPKVLIEEGIPPFADTTGPFSLYRWDQPTSDCYLGLSSESDHPAFALVIKNSHAEIFWNYELPPEFNCTQFSNWQTVKHHD